MLPADWLGQKLYQWNQRIANHPYGNPWKLATGNQGATSNPTFARVATTGVNSGTSVFFNRLDSGWTPQYIWILPVEKTGATVFNWVHDKVNHKYAYEFFLNNNLEETSPAVIYDDDETFWATYKWGSGSVDITLSEETTIKAKGTSSLKMQVGAGSYSVVGCQHDYGSGQDWSAKEFLCLYLYGANSGKTVRIMIIDTGSDDRRIDIVENFTGWKRFVIPFLSMTQTGTLDLNAIRWIRVYYVNAAGAETLYLDRTLIDFGQWVKLEAYIPDRLDSAVQNVRLHAWGGASYGQFFAWDAEDDSPAESGSGSSLRFLDGTAATSIWSGAMNNYLSAFLKGDRGQAAATAYGSQAMTYGAFYGCVKRVGFALKMPPDDGKDSSTTGISQIRLKIEVFYADSGDPSGLYGQTTYEFSYNTNQYTGIQNWNEPWMLLYDLTLKRAYYFIFSTRPTALKACADENESMQWIEAALPAGTKVYAGEIYHANILADSDSNGVPDFLESSQVPSMIKGVSIW